ncbi:DUF4314 domain-containing protein [Caldifermentibacillus hisashii]|uniref:DUF4314 domain-containing protein n=1 Tax=Caldifermentibacillus hisashii TaxID=996558 RepID=A0ABU9K474_9BACI
MTLTESEQPTSHTVVNKKIIENIQRIYKKGLQVELLNINDKSINIPVGTKAEVVGTDDQGRIFVKLPTNRIISLHFGQDQFNLGG